MDLPSVLIVDDEKDIVTLISDFLEMSDFQVVGCSYDGNEAISMFESLTPDIVIMDYHLPKHNGDYVLEKIRKAKQNTVVMMVSSDRSIQSDTNLLKLKPDAIIIKPFDMIKILKTMKELFSKQLVFNNS